MLPRVTTLHVVLIFIYSNYASENYKHYLLKVYFKICVFSFNDYASDKLHHMNIKSTIPFNDLTIVLGMKQCFASDNLLKQAELCFHVSMFPCLPSVPIKIQPVYTLYRS